MSADKEELVAALAVIEQMRAIVADPVSDYYGEIRVQFNAIVKAPMSALAKAKADALREAARVMDQQDADSRHVHWLNARADRIEKEATA